MKKITSLFLSVIMLFSITAGLDMSTYANTSGDFEYVLLDDGTAEITAYTGTKTELTIPSTIDGYNVTSIGDYPFGFAKLVKVVLPKGLKSIGNQSFYSCKDLIDVTIPDSVENIGISAFNSCELLTEIKIPYSVTNIGEAAFLNCSSLTHITVENNNMNYSSLNGVLYNRVKSVLIQYPCGKAETSYAIPDSVTNIGKHAFQNCNNLANLTIPDSVTNIDSFALQNCRNLTSITIPDSVTSIGDDAFWGCSSLKKVIIGKNVLDLGYYLFGGCFELSDIVITDNIKSIGEYTFSQCFSLTQMIIPINVTSIGDHAFYRCSGLNSIFIYNKNCNIHDDEYTIPKNTTIYGYPNSTAQKYAEKYNRNFIAIDEKECVKHIYDDVIVTKPATNKADGTKVYNCTVCGQTKNEVIPKASNITLSRTSITYTGTVQRPTVTVTDRTGKALTYKKDFTVSYSNWNSTDVGEYKVTVNLMGNYEGTYEYTYKILPQTRVTPKLNRTAITMTGTVQRPLVTVTDVYGNQLVYKKDFTVSYSNWNSKNVGRYTVTVKMQGNYSGTYTYPYYINPKPTTLSSVTAKSKGFTVKWNKQTSQTTGYQIQYATKKDFSNAATIYGGPSTAASKTINGRAGKTRYYVRIRTYKNIGGKYFYSTWSSAKSVVTLK